MRTRRRLPSLAIKGLIFIQRQVHQFKAAEIDFSVGQFKAVATLDTGMVTGQYQRTILLMHHSLHDYDEVCTFQPQQCSANRSVTVPTSVPAAIRCLVRATTPLRPFPNDRYSSHSRPGLLTTSTPYPRGQCGTWTSTGDTENGEEYT